MSFSHFGTLDAGKQGRGSVFTSLVINVVLLVIAAILGAAAKKVAEQHKLTMLTEPVPIKKVEPKPIPKPKPLPKPPEIKVQPPKIQMAEKLPEIPKPVEVKMPTPTPQPIILHPAPPKLVQPPPAPVKVNLARAEPASVVNNSSHPSAVSLGQQNNPIAPQTGPAVSNVNLGQRGLAGMPPGSGMGPASTKVNLGSGSPQGTMGGTDNASRPVQGVKLGVPGGTGPLNSPGRVAGPVNLGQTQQAAVTKPSLPTQTAAATAAPKVLFKPKPEYTEEARRLRLEGNVYVRVRVLASGQVQVLGVSSGLGHGLDEAAVRVVQAMRFQPAMQDGHPVDWTGVVNVGFQMLS